MEERSINSSDWSTTIKRRRARSPQFDNLLRRRSIVILLLSDVDENKGRDRYSQSIGEPADRAIHPLRSSTLRPARLDDLHSSVLFITIGIASFDR